MNKKWNDTKSKKRKRKKFIKLQHYMPEAYYQITQFATERTFKRGSAKKQYPVCEKIDVSFKSSQFLFKLFAVIAKGHEWLFTFEKVLKMLCNREQ